jgi:phosphatidylglycerophosphate synthase
MNDLSSMLVEPWINYLPAHTSPNTISLVNHFVVIGTVILALYAKHMQHELPAAAALMLLACSVLNYISTVLDCLDGAWARKSGKTSKFGAFLDHSLDAAHVPLLTAMGCVVLDMPCNLAMVVIWCNMILYYTEIIDSVFTNTFTHVAGVEAQLVLTVTLAIASLSCYFQCDLSTGGVIVGVVAVYVAVGNATTFPFPTTLFAFETQLAWVVPIMAMVGVQEMYSVNGLVAIVAIFWWLNRQIIHCHSINHGGIDKGRWPHFIQVLDVVLRAGAMCLWLNPGANAYHVPGITIWVVGLVCTFLREFDVKQ